MLKKIVIIVGALALPVAASAADLPMKAPPVSAAAPFNWTGFYIGVNAGGGMAAVRFDDQCYYCNSHTPTKAFATFGGQLGYNYQFGNGLIGIEADVNGNTIDNNGLLGGDDSVAMNVNVKADVSGTIRGRAGLVMNNALVYVTGGAAWADVKQTGTEFTNNTKVPTGVTANSSGVLWGAVIGGGAEFALNRNWTVRAEYLHTMYENRDTTMLNSSGAPVCSSTRTCLISNQLTTDVVRIGINYMWK